MRTVSWLLGATLLLLLGSGVGTPGAVAQTENITVGYSNIAGGELPLWVATDAGFFSQHGLTVSPQLIAGGANTVAALLASQIDIADAGGSEALSAVANGADLVVLATQAPVYPYVFEVVPAITAPTDLIGKKIGVATFGGSADIATRVVLRQIGINPETDVTLVATGSAANRTAALLSGSIQGGMAAGPPDTLDLEAQGLHPLFDLAALKLPAANTAVIARRAWVSANRALVQQYIDALVEASAHLKQDRAGSIQVLQQYFKSQDDAAMAATYDFNASEVLASQPFPRPEQFTDALQQLSLTNPRVGEVDLSSVLDPSFVQDAVDRGLGG